MLQLIAYIPKVLLMVFLFIDVFFFEKFFYSYYILYLLLLTIISKTILYVSIEINDRIITECTNSIEAANFGSMITDYYNSIINRANYQLSEYNTQFTSVDQVFNIAAITLSELDKLQKIKEQTTIPLYFILLVRVFYIIIFGYIVYYYPLSF